MKTTIKEQDLQFRDNEVSLKELILKVAEWCRYLLSKWYFVFFVGTFGAALGFFYTNSKKPIYSAVCTFVLEQSSTSGGLGQYAGIASMMGIDVGGGGGIFEGDNIIELYKSRTMIQKTLLSEVEVHGNKQLLIDRYIENNDIRSTWKNDPKSADIQFNINKRFTRIQDSLIGSIVNVIRGNYLKVSKPDKKLSIIKVEVNAEDELFAKNFNDKIVKNVNDFYVQTKTKKALSNVRILQQKVDSVKNVMNGAVYNAVAISDATPNSNPARQVQTVVPVQRAQISVETNKAILGELIKNLEMSKMSLRQETPLIQIIDEPIYPLEKKQFGRVKGIALGGLIAGFLAVSLLLVVKIFRNILS